MDATTAAVGRDAVLCVIVKTANKKFAKAITSGQKSSFRNIKEVLNDNDVQKCIRERYKTSLVPNERDILDDERLRPDQLKIDLTFCAKTLRAFDYKLIEDYKNTPPQYIATLDNENLHVSRILWVRNEILSHKADHEISKEEFMEVWEKLQKALEGLDVCVDTIHEWKYKPITEKEIDALKRQREMEAEMRATSEYIIQMIADKINSQCRWAGVAVAVACGLIAVFFIIRK